MLITKGSLSHEVVRLHVHLFTCSMGSIYFGAALLHAKRYNVMGPQVVIQAPIERLFLFLAHSIPLTIQMDWASFFFEVTLNLFVLHKVHTRGVS
jgi:hypothetical protein